MLKICAFVFYTFNSEEAFVVIKSCEFFVKNCEFITFGQHVLVNIWCFPKNLQLNVIP
jgi:hypothetical protein